MKPLDQLHHDIERFIERLEEVPDPKTRCNLAVQAAEYLRIGASKRVGAIRQQTVSQLHDDGWSIIDIADELGISRARAQQLTSGITPLMRKKWNKTKTIR